MMDDEDDVTYRSDTYTANGQKFPVENASYPRDVGNSYGEDDDNDDDDDEEDDEKAINDVDDEDEDDDDDDDGGNGVQRISNNEYEYGDEDDNNDDDNGDQQRHPKKRKLKNLISSYEFAPRLPAPPPAAPSAPKPSYGGRNPLTDWTEHETLVLLDAWGDRFLKHGRKSLRSEEWQEVAEKVSQGSKIERTDTQCRNRLDTLKKKYKKEKMKFGDSGSEWVYFKKIDALLSSSQVQQTGLSCGIDSGEYVFMNPKVYLNRSNGLDEMRDSPGNSTEGEEDESEGLPPKKTTRNGKIRGSAASFKMLADSFHKFSEIYERIEDSKRQQMVELEKMRMDFHRDLELQKREILERGQAEIAKIRQGEDEENTASAENMSG
ncbi:trihelix transcription factor ENAP1-like [Salvia miltiorrhiza]|uniref:trihelix transcription factor ENAP1-like n=1 Tax=Salvia miltiorrhiza TaxID=226208 RepID=UPI0025ACEC42|nr:trihelix transcription factor ENAP1-like [Salvia miltiorrhiza]